MCLPFTSLIEDCSDNLWSLLLNQWTTNNTVAWLGLGSLTSLTVKQKPRTLGSYNKPFLQFKCFKSVIDCIILKGNLQEFFLWVWPNHAGKFHQKGGGEKKKRNSLCFSDFFCMMNKKCVHSQGLEPLKSLCSSLNLTASNYLNCRPN